MAKDSSCGDVRQHHDGTSLEYWKDVRDYAASAVSNENWSKDVALLDRVNELVNGSEWVIYTWRNLRVLQHTAHFDAYEDRGCGGVGGSVSEILTGLAYYAMIADVHAEIGRLEFANDHPDFVLED